MVKRSEVRVEDTWDLSHIFSSLAEQELAQNKLQDDAADFVSRYRGQIESTTSAEFLVESWRDLEQLISDGTEVASYIFLDYSVDMINQEKMRRNMTTNNVISKIFSDISFYESELEKLPEELIRKAIELEAGSAKFFGDHLRERPHRLSAASEQLLTALNGATGSLPEQIYDSAKFADLSFPDFQVNGKKYPLSFASYEEYYAMHADTGIRREAFRVFSENLAKYRNTIATGYYSHVKQDVILAEKRSYENVFTYLLQDQQVEESLYHRQIDVTMDKLAPHMRKYAQKLGENWQLDRVTYADLKLPPLREKSISVSREKAEQLVLGALEIMGDEYRDLAKRAFEERWMDFAENEGKSTGGFCSSTMNTHPYILLNWTGQMPDVFTIIHELGHAAQAEISRKTNNALNASPSLYFIEAPSTFNETLMSQYLIRTSKDPDVERMVAAQMSSNTYYHNFVTHFLEAHWQREVYRAVAADQALTADDLDQLFLDTLQDFWGDDVEMTPGAERTWMRQPHYYRGLYSYTYSAGLTVATAVSLRIEKEGQAAVQDWLDTLALGGRKTPLELARNAGVDISTDKPLCDTIAYIGSLIDRL
ncbi:MAG: oligoendopeptidase F [Clostridiaceae bacterium]|nr:oligoendopeptidase F [Clostridiaceae bacterium]